MECRSIRKNSMEMRYELTRKRIKNINIRVKDDGRVLVSAPKNALVSEIEACLLERFDWILTCQARLNQKTKLIFPKDSQSVRPRFEAALGRMWRMVEADGIPLPTLRLRAMKSRWGSCIPSKRQICLNTALAELDDALMDYVILHELAHFIHLNHSASFWAYVARYMPDWKSRRTTLANYRLCDADQSIER